MELNSGTLLNGGTYRVERILGQGGFGITYLATHIRLKKKVAIKEFFPKNLCDRNPDQNTVSTTTITNTELVDRLKKKFLKEAEHIAAMDSPYIVKIVDVFEENGTAYYIMDYIEGETLSSMVKKDGPLSVVKAVEYIRKIGEALSYVHEKKINHLDVKPANIIVRRKDDTPILVDFGLSKQYDSEGNQTSTTPVGISHGFAPMEQYNDGGVKEFSPKTDLYGLAATLYYSISGIVPPNATTLIDDELRIPPGIPLSIASSIRKAMAPQRKKRHETIRDFVSEISGNIDDTIPQMKTSQAAGVYKDSEDETTQFAFGEDNVVNNTIEEETYEEEHERSILKSPKIWIALLVVALLIVGGVFMFRSEDESSDLMEETAIVSDSIDNVTEEPSESGKEIDNKQTASQEKENVTSSKDDVVANTKKDNVEPQEKTESPVSPKTTGTGNERISEKEEMSKASSIDEIFIAPMQVAEFPGGQVQLAQWLASNIQYPAVAAENEVQGRVIVKFVVEKDGSISQPSVVKGVDHDLDKEALRIVKAMPRWTPAKNDGETVRSYFTLPISFRLNK